MSDMRCQENGIEHRLTKVKHPCTNGQAERMNRTIKEATLTPHKDYLVGQKHILVVGGALTSAADEPVGSLYIVNVPDRKAAEAFSKNDPFTAAGVFGTVTITAMRKSHWNPGSA